MPLKNYRTRVTADVSIMQIERMLLGRGARKITKTYDGRRVAGFEFVLSTEQTGEQVYRMPVNVAGVQQALKADGVNVDADRATDVAWRLLKDWLDSQLAAIDANLLGLDEVLFAHIVTDDGSRIFERFVGQQKALMSGRKEAE